MTAAVVAVALIGVAGFVALRNTSPTNAASTTPTATPSAGGVACGAKAPTTAGQKKPSFAHAPKMSIDPNKTYTATIQTSCGTIVMKLLAARAPKTVNSFVFLASKGFYDGLIIHRIDTSIGIIQGGDPNGTGSGGPGYSTPDELTGKETYGPGVVAMANSGPNTDGSQFFVVYDKNGHKLDTNPAYTIFARVVKGLDVARRIAAIPVQDAAGGPGPGQKPLQTVYLDKVTISARA